jgi:hypothetical protein
VNNQFIIAGDDRESFTILLSLLLIRLHQQRPCFLERKISGPADDDLGLLLVFGKSDTPKVSYELRNLSTMPLFRTQAGLSRRKNWSGNLSIVFAGLDSAVLRTNPLSLRKVNSSV